MPGYVEKLAAKQQELERSRQRGRQLIGAAGPDFAVRYDAREDLAFQGFWSGASLAAERRWRNRPLAARIGRRMVGNTDGTLWPTEQGSLDQAAALLGSAGGQLVLEMPEDDTMEERFPGIDPLLHYSAIDMKFAQREAAVEAAMATRSSEVQRYARELLDRCRGSECYEQMMAISREHRTLTRAEKIWPPEKAASFNRAVRLEARELESSADVANYDNVLQAVEYIVGLRTGPIPREVEECCQAYLKTNLEKGMAVKGQVPDKELRTLAIDFPDVENVSLQRAFSRRDNYGKPREELEAAEAGADAAAVENSLSAYNRALTNRALDPLYQNLETGTNHMVHRNDLVIVDGKTIRERAMEDYVKTRGGPDGFSAFYQENRDALAGSYVAAALMAGRRVEDFVSDRQGRLSEEPVQITRTGYEPSPLQPEHFSGWQRFFSKRGFFKEKVARQQAYEQGMAARERVRSLYAVKQHQMDLNRAPCCHDQYFGGWEEQHGKITAVPGSRYSVSRTALSTMAICKMLRDGHLLSGILDPQGFSDEKQAAGREVMERVSALDDAWVGDVLFHGQRIAMQQLNDLAKRMDMTRRETLLSPQAREAFLAVRVMFDACQESDKCKQEVCAAAQRYVEANGIRQSGQEYVETMKDHVDAVASYFDFFNEAVTAQVELAGGLVQGDNAAPNFGKITKYELFRRAYAARRADAPDAPMTDHFTLQKTRSELTVNNALNLNESFQNFSDRMMRDSKLSRAVGQEALEGRLQKRIYVANRGGGEVDFAFAPPQAGEPELSVAPIEGARVVRVPSQSVRAQAPARPQPQAQSKASEKAKTSPQPGVLGR